MIGFFENFLFGLEAAQGGTLPVFYNPTNRKSTMVASDDIGAEVATLLTGPAWSGHRVIELGSMVSADEVAAQLGEVLKLDVKAVRRPEGPHWTCRRKVRERQRGMDGPRSHGYRARSGYDVRARCVRGCTERPQGVSPGKLNQPGSFKTAALTSGKIELKHEGSCLGATAGTGQLIVRFHTGERPFRRGPGSLAALD
jgi:hypothetical protein